jgi:hypothetical protein
MRMATDGAERIVSLFDNRQSDEFGFLHEALPSTYAFKLNRALPATIFQLGSKS